jgi:hypothetical protein
LCQATEYIRYFPTSKSGPVERIESITGYRVALEAIEPSNPSILFQNVTTEPNVNYTLAFKVYYETITTTPDRSSILVEFGAMGAISLHLLANETLSHSSSSNGLGPSDHIKLTSEGNPGGRFIIYDVSITTSL